jgi:hypothetical protein
MTIVEVVVVVSVKMLSTKKVVVVVCETVAAWVTYEV